MSYEDTNCPCGDRKQNDTMLCDTCCKAFADRREMKTYLSGDPLELRRHAATILLSLARSRKRIEAYESQRKAS